MPLSKDGQFLDLNVFRFVVFQKMLQNVLRGFFLAILKIKKSAGLCDQIKHFIHF